MIARVLLAAAAALTMTFAASAADQRFGIHAGQIVKPDGSLGPDRIVIVADGAIESIIAADDAPADLTVLDRSAAVVSPGLIDMMSLVGVFRNNSDVARNIDTELSAVSAFDPEADDVEDALRAGITSLQIAPGPDMLIPGSTSVVATWPFSSPRVHARSVALQLGFGPSTWRLSSEPSSRAGALHLMRMAFDEAEDGDTIDRAVSGKSPIVVHCPERQDVSAALRLLASRGAAPVVVHSLDLIELADEMAEYEVPGVIAGPYEFSDSRRILAGAAACEAHDIEIGFHSGAPWRSPEQLRMSATLAVRNGMSAAAARRALTSSAAAIAGVSDKVGALRAGLDADLVVFSGDPLQPESRVLEVYVRGIRVYTAHEAQATTGSEGGPTG